MRIQVLGVVLTGLGCPATTHPPSEGCTKDVDCKGDRICVDSQCVAGAADETAAPEREPNPPSRPGAWYRGGPGHAGTSSAIAPRKRPVLAWERDLGSVVFATPTLAETASGTTAYVGTHAGRFVGVAVAGPRAGEVELDLQVGGRIWATAAATGVGAELRLFVGTDDDELSAIAPAKPVAERIVWTLKLGNCSGTRAPGPEGARCDVDGGPTVGPDGDLYVGADGVYRISPTGEIRWHWPASEVELAKHVFSSPVVTVDGAVTFGGQDGFVTSVNAADGTLRWQYRIESDVDGSGVIGADGAFFIGADDGRIHALRSDGSLRWSFVAQRDIRSSIAIAPSGTIYATSFDGSLYAIDSAGAVEWVLPTGGVIQSSPVVDAAGTVLFGSQDDHLYAVSADGEILWTIELPGDIDSSIALAADGTLVVGCDDGKLRAFGPPAE